MNIIKKLIRNHHQKKARINRHIQAKSELYAKTLSDLAYVEADGDRTSQLILLMKHMSR